MGWSSDGSKETSGGKKCWVLPVVCLSFDLLICKAGISFLPSFLPVVVKPRLLFLCIISNIISISVPALYIPELHSCARPDVAYQIVFASFIRWWGFSTPPASRLHGFTASHIHFHTFTSLSRSRSRSFFLYLPLSPSIPLSSLISLHLSTLS